MASAANKYEQIHNTHYKEKRGQGGISTFDSFLLSEKYGARSAPINRFPDLEFNRFNNNNKYNNASRLRSKYEQTTIYEMVQ